MKVYIDCNDKKQRKEMVDYVYSKISAAEKFGRCSSVIRLGWMKKIGAVMERQEEIIEEQEKRIAIMSEGQMDDYEKRDKETAELVWRIMRWIGENVDLTDDERCFIAKIDQKAFEKY